MKPEEREAWRRQHERDLAETAAAKRLEREARRERNRAANQREREARSVDAEQLALDELVAKRLKIPVEGVPAWRTKRRAEMAALGTFEEQMAKAPAAGKEES